MKLLIFGHTAFYNKALDINEMSNGGGWMDSLIKELHQIPHLNIGLCDGSDTIHYAGRKWIKERQHEMDYYHWPYHKKRLLEKISDAIHYKDASRDERIWPYYLKIYEEIIKDFDPDIIHVFGTEVYLQLAAIAAKDRPLVLHLQGLLSISNYALLPPGISRWNYIMKDGIKKAYFNFQELAAWEKGAHREKAILHSTHHVLGRTKWDKQALEILAPQAKYHYGGEILRPVFYENKDREIPTETIIVTTLSAPLYKGFDLILKIADIMRNQLNMNFSWKVYGGPNARFIEKHFGIKHDEVNVALMGRATAEEIKSALCSASIYVQSSYTENSPNSLAEAQMCGLPIVATNVGGTSSMVEDGVTGMLFPATDPYMAAHHIWELSHDLNRNRQMGNRGKETAQKRHNPITIVENLLSTYKSILNHV